MRLNFGGMVGVFSRKELKARRRGLRKLLPDPERALWTRLRNRQLSGYKFRRQYSIENFVVDFYSPEAKLVIEIDGSNHTRKAIRAYDAWRQNLIILQGVKVIRFSNEEVINNMDVVLETIKEHLPD